MLHNNLVSGLRRVGFRGSMVCAISDLGLERLRGLHRHLGTEPSTLNLTP